MTQLEFDTEMARLNAEQNAKTAPLKDEMNHINDERNKIQAAIYSPKCDILKLAQKYNDISNEVRRINGEYHDMKHQLIMENPKRNNN